MTSPQRHGGAHGRGPVGPSWQAALAAPAHGFRGRTVSRCSATWRATSRRPRARYASRTSTTVLPSACMGWVLLKHRPVPWRFSNTRSVALCRLREWDWEPCDGTSKDDSTLFLCVKAWNTHLTSPARPVFTANTYYHRALASVEISWGLEAKVEALIWRNPRSHLPRIRMMNTKMENA